MTAQRFDIAQGAPPWDPARLRRALSTAHEQAKRGGRRLRLSRADCDDLRQDILLAMVLRCRHYDPARGAWSTFVGLLARNVVADHARAQRQRIEPILLPLDVDDFPNGCSATQQDHVDPTLSLDLERVAGELPAAPQAVLRLLGAEGDLPRAQRASTLSPASFYRSVADLRFWLRATGMQPASGRLRRQASAAG